jgi:hypothetical protein
MADCSDMGNSGARRKTDRQSDNHHLKKSAMKHFFTLCTAGLLVFQLPAQYKELPNHLVYDSVHGIETNPYLKEYIYSYSNPERPYREYGYFFPYLPNTPFVDSLSNLHSQAEVTRIFNATARRDAKARVDPQALRPVITADQVNDFFFMLDLATLSQADEQRAYDFLCYFNRIKSPQEQMAIFCKDRQGIVRFSHPTDSVYAFNDLENRLALKWEEYRHRSTLLPTMSTTEMLSDAEMRHGKYPGSVAFPNRSVFIHLGRHSRYQGYEFMEFDHLTNNFKYDFKYLHTIDLDETDTYGQFDYIIRQTGGAEMRMRWGNALLTDIILNRLVMCYVYDNRPVPDYQESARSPQTRSWISIFLEAARRPQPVSAPQKLPPAGTSPRPESPSRVEPERPAGRE